MKLVSFIKSKLPTVERICGCTGIRFPLFGRKQIEFWHAPGGGEIPPHVHESVDSHIFYLWGKVDVMVDGRTASAIGPIRKRKSTGRWVWAHRFIPAGHVHSAKIRSKRGIFCVLETCHSKPVSASRDFIPVS